MKQFVIIVLLAAFSNCSKQVAQSNTAKPSETKKETTTVQTTPKKENTYTIVNAPADNLTDAEKKKALSIANDAVKNKVNIPEGSQVSVQKKGDNTVVIFINKIPAGARGADYTAKVTIDKAGKVIEVLGGD